MTLNEIAEKALAKADELLSNPGAWNGANTAKLSAEAVWTLLAVGNLVKSEPPAEKSAEAATLPVESAKIAASGGSGKKLPPKPSAE